MKFFKKLISFIKNKFFVNEINYKEFYEINKEESYIEMKETSNFINEIRNLNKSSFRQSIEKEISLYGDIKYNEHCTDSKFFFGVDSKYGNKIRKRDIFIKELLEIFPDFNVEDLQKISNYTFLELYKKSNYSDFANFMYDFAALTTRQITFFVYANYYERKNIVYERSGAVFNKKPKRKNWFYVNKDQNFLLFRPSKHLLYLEDYLNSSRKKFI